MRCFKALDMAKSARCDWPRCPPVPAAGLRLTPDRRFGEVAACGRTGTPARTSPAPPANRDSRRGHRHDHLRRWDGAYGWKTIERLDDGTEIWYAHQSAMLVRSGRVYRARSSAGRLHRQHHRPPPAPRVPSHGGDPINPMPLAHRAKAYTLTSS